MASAEPCEFCLDDEHASCDNCGHETLERVCPSCGCYVCEMEAYERGRPGPDLSSSEGSGS